MDLNPVSTTSASGATKSQSQLAANFDTFLVLLTAQLKNQDPLEPMDSNQFTQQLVQFSQVEQQINSNKNLESLIALSKASTATDAVSYLGKTVTLTDGTAALMDGQANWAYSLDNKASSATLYIKNMRGDVVYSAPAEMNEGLHSFTWDGVSKTGAMLSPGPYQLSVVAKTVDGEAIKTRVASQGVISEVDLTGDEPLLMIGPLGIPLSKAMLLSQTQ